MGTLTLANFRTELIFELRNRTDVSDSRLNRWINQAYRHVCFPSVHRHWEVEALFTITLVTSDFDYTLVATPEILGIRSARYVDAVADSFTASRSALRPRSLSWFNGRMHTTGRPSFFTIARKQLLVSPGPGPTEAGDVVVLETWRDPVVLVNDIDTTVLLNYWDEVILVGARWIAETRLGYGELAEQSKQEFATLVNEAPQRNDIIDEQEGWFADINTGDPVMPS